MFTDIVEELVSVEQLQLQENSVYLRISVMVVIADVTHGASITVNGVCFILTEFNETFFAIGVTAMIMHRAEQQHWIEVDFQLPLGLLPYIVEKGSSVCLIPTTLVLAILWNKALGDRVNVEVGVLAKHVERFLAPWLVTKEAV